MQKKAFFDKFLDKNEKNAEMIQKNEKRLDF